MSVIRLYQCLALNRHKSFIDKIITPYNTFQVACSAYAAISSPSTTETITFDAACNTFFNAVDAAGTIGTHDQYAALDVTGICQTLGARKPFKVPTISICSTELGFINPAAVFIPGTTSVVMTPGGDYTDLTFNRAVQACVDAVDAQLSNAQIHIVRSSDCSAGASSSNLVEGKAIAIAACSEVVGSSIDS